MSDKIPRPEDREWIDGRADQLFRDSERTRGGVRSNTFDARDHRDYFVAQAAWERALYAEAAYHKEAAIHDQRGLEYSSLVGVPISNAEELRYSVEFHEQNARRILDLLDTPEPPDGLLFGLDEAMQVLADEGQAYDAAPVKPASDALRLATEAMVDAAFKALPPDAHGTIGSGEMYRVLEAALAAAPASQPDAAPFTCIGVKDANGDLIHLGDRVVYKLEGRHTAPEYWNPEYEIVWEAPRFTLKHVGGGKDSGSHDFKLKCGGRNGCLFITQRAAPQPDVCPKCAGTGWTDKNGARLTLTRKPCPNGCQPSQPDADEREALRDFIRTKLPSVWDRTDESIADALLTAGWRKPRSRAPQPDADAALKAELDAYTALSRLEPPPRADEREAMKDDLSTVYQQWLSDDSPTELLDFQVDALLAAGWRKSC